MFVGWDWASATHDVTVLDDAGAALTAGRCGIPNTTWRGCWGDWPALGSRPRYRSSSSAAAAWSWSACSPLGIRSCPCTPAFWAARPRWGASGAKSDAGDSYKDVDRGGH